MGRKANERFVCSCGEQCVMVAHEKTGKLAPITIKAYDNGNIVLLGNGCYRIVSKAERAADPRSRLLNHWASCPDAGSFRR
jgi:hypothetical protein